MASAPRGLLVHRFALSWGQVKPTERHWNRFWVVLGFVSDTNAAHCFQEDFVVLRFEKAVKEHKRRVLLEIFTDAAFAPMFDKGVLSQVA